MSREYLPRVLRREEFTPNTYRRRKVSYIISFSRKKKKISHWNVTSLDYLGWSGSLVPVFSTTVSHRNYTALLSREIETPKGGVFVYRGWISTLFVGCLRSSSRKMFYRPVIRSFDSSTIFCFFKLFDSVSSSRIPLFC